MEVATSEKAGDDSGEIRRTRRTSEPSGDEEDLQLLSPEEREKRRKFEQKRKAHYNEFYAVKMARQLMEEAGDDDEDEDTKGAEDAANGDNTNPGISGAEVAPMETASESN